MPPPGSPQFSIAPSSQAFGKGLAYRAAIFLPLIVVGFLGNRNSDLPAGAVWGIIGLGVLIGALAIALMVTRVSIVGPDVVIKRLIGTIKRVPLQAITKTVLAVQYEQFGNTIAPTFAAVAQGRRPFLRLSGQVYDLQALTALTRALGRADVIQAPVTPKMLEQRHPGLLSFYERRPWAFAWIVVALIIVMCVVIGVAAQG